MFKWFKKKENPSLPTIQPQPLEPKAEPKIEVRKLSVEEKIELISAQIEAMNERIKNIERMVEEIYKIAKS
ncbi:MAG: hypothetical protein QW040_03815 [Candidatus Aenigmatarchaeota archaeon]